MRPSPSRLLLAGLALLAIGVVLAPTAAGASGWVLATTGNELTIANAIVLGIVEGVTEYLPISSTGHLTVAERLLDIGQTGATRSVTTSYTVIIQIGAILAVLLLYWSRIADMAAGIVGRSVRGRHLFLALVVAFIPAGIIGFAFSDPIQDRLFGAGPVAAAWIVGGVAILVYVWHLEPPAGAGVPLDQLSLRQALIIGVAQAVALWPGVSRSLVTIVAAVLVGLTLAAAVEFSFLLGLATLSAASSYEIVRNGSEVIDAFGWVSPLVGIVASFVAAAIAIKWMVGYLQRHDLSIFGWYRIAIGLVTVVLLVTNTI
ncbi:MAG TPA: undecaprenyl-diphosphate phosphatase [Acidimicrobiia bacterium]|nr:undecaprenyl-diphosphate phosphatase [Acidimicrobiia bacterium]